MKERDRGRESCYRDEEEVMEEAKDNDMGEFEFVSSRPLH